MGTHSGWIAIALALASLGLTPVAAQSEDAFQAGYRRGYQDGFRDGQRGGGAGSAPSYVPPASQSGSYGQRNYGYGRTRGLQVLGALYGDGDRDCDATQLVASQFNGRASAALKVSNSLCGDPAPGERKSLRVEYACGQERRTVSAYEHRSLEASCGQ